MPMTSFVSMTGEDAPEMHECPIFTHDSPPVRHYICHRGLRRSVPDRLRSRAAVSESTFRLCRDNCRTQDLPQSLATQLIDGLDQHHDALARELHDVVGQSLTGVKLALFHLRSQLLIGSPSLEEPLTLCLETVDDSIRSVRQFAHSLHGNTVRDTGLNRAVTGYLELIGLSTGLKMQYEIAPGIDGIRDEVAHACYRILQEAVTNCVKHAGAAHLRTSLNLTHHGLLLQIEDDGKGFNNPLSLASGSSLGLGLVSMRERARLSGGRFSVESSPGKGTRVAATWPTRFL